MSVEARAAVNARDFLVHRLVNSTAATGDNNDDSRRQSATLSDGEDHGSSASSEDSGSSTAGDHQLHMSAAAAAAAAAMANLNPATAFAGLTNANQMYAAAFAHLAQMNLMNPAMTSGMLPMFAPGLYHRFFSFPNLDQLRAALQSPQQKSPMDRPSPMSAPEKGATTLTPSPSPRKRANQSGKSKPAAVNAEDLSASPQKRARAVKRLAFTDDETSSPVSGMYIKEAASVPSTEQLQAEADLDDSAQFVEVTEEARAEIAKIPNVIGDYVCTLCKVKYDDAFKLAQHRCPRIMHEEYRCPECDKVFSCPANLASHRRWHKPKDGVDVSLECAICATRCETKKQLRAHAASHAHINAWNNPPDQLADTPEQSINENQATFECRFCSETFTSSPTLTRHINKHHPNDRCNVILLNN